MHILHLSIQCFLKDNKHAKLSANTLYIREDVPKDKENVFCIPLKKTVIVSLPRLAWIKNTTPKLVNIIAKNSANNVLTHLILVKVLSVCSNYFFIPIITVFFDTFSCTFSIVI